MRIDSDLVLEMVFINNISNIVKTVLFIKYFIYLLLTNSKSNYLLSFHSSIICNSFMRM